MTDDLLKRLRAKGYLREIWVEPTGAIDVSCDAEDCGAEAYFLNPDGPDAADRIETQAAEIERLKVECQAQYHRGYYDGRAALGETE